MKEMNESLGVEYHGSMEKLQELNVLKSKAKNLPITREGMVLVNLTGHRAVSIRPEHTGRLIPSNFAIIEPKKNLDGVYLEWFLNEHPYCRKQLRIATQGTIVAALSIQMLRSLQIELPSLSQQQAIGGINRILDRKKRLVSERLQLEEQLIKHLSLRYLKEEIK
jgi:restriction endonuclease S subunit